MKTTFTTIVKVIVSVIILGVVSFSSTSCSRNYPVVKDVTPHKIFHMTIEGHDYIIVEYKESGTPFNTSGMVHDPNCPCHNK